MLRVNSATRNLAENAEFVEIPGQIPPPYGRRDDSEFALFYKAGQAGITARRRQATAVHADGMRSPFNHLPI